MPVCPQCERANPEDAAFCSGCGAPLERLCPACQRANAADAAFCNGCGERLVETGPESGSPSPVDRAPRDYTPKHLADKILQSKSALEGERKQKLASGGSSVSQLAQAAARGVPQPMQNCASDGFSRWQLEQINPCDP